MGLLEHVRKLPYNHTYRWDGRKFGHPKLWTPDEIDTTIWCDAYDEDTITESGGSVSQWDDKSGNANHLTQSTGADQPVTGTRTIGGYNVIDFDGTTQHFDIPGSGTIDVIGKETWLLYNIDAMPLNRPPLLGGGGNDQSAAHDTAKMRIWAATNPYSADTKGPSVSTATDYIGGFLSHSDTKKFSQNGTLTTTTDTYNSGSLTPDFLGQGQYDKFNGMIGEFIITDSALSTDDRQKMEGYLAWKWGLEGSLPGSHPYADEPPTVP